MKLKKVLVTGGAGFIGGNFVQYMVRKYRDYQIYNLDALTYAGDVSKHELIERESNYSFIQANIVDYESMYALFKEEKFDYVIHFAAESHVDRSITNPNVFVQTNVLGTQNLLEVSKMVGIQKFVHVSTDEVYGQLELNNTELFVEETPLNPTSPYSASKASSDLMVLAYHKTFGLPVNITRCSNNYGPYQFPEKLIPLTILSALNDEKIPVYGRGNNIRDWLHVYDHCTALDLILHEGVNGEVYNIGGNNERKNIDVVKLIINALNKPNHLIEYVQDRLAHDLRYAINATKLEKLGWNQTYTFETGLSETIQWYLNHKNWWGPILDKHSFDRVGK